MNNKHKQDLEDSKALAEYNNFTLGSNDKVIGNINKKLQASSSCIKKLRRPKNTSVGDLFTDKEWQALKKLSE